MNINQLKFRINLFRALDVILMGALAGVVIYTIFYAKNKEYMIAVCLGGLFVVSTIGKFTNKRIALMGVKLEMLKREKKTEEQRTLMGTRHTLSGRTRSTIVKTNPTNPTNPTTKK